MSLLKSWSPRDVWVWPIQPSSVHRDSEGRPYIDFDATMSETIYMTGVAPLTFGSTLTLVVTYYAACATVGTVLFTARVEAGLSGFAAPNPSTSTTVPNTLSSAGKASIPLADDDGLAPGDYFRASITRNTTADTAVGKIRVLDIELRDEV